MINMLKHVLLCRSRIEIPQNDLIIAGQYSGRSQSRSWKALIVCMTAMINHKFISFSAV